MKQKKNETKREGGSLMVYFETKAAYLLLLFFGLKTLICLISTTFVVVFVVKMC